MSRNKAVSVVVWVGIAVVCSSCASVPRAGHPDTRRWQNLLKEDLSNCIYKPGSWTMENGVLTRHGGGDIWTRQQYGDFILDLEFKLAKGTNSGVFFRTADIRNWLHTGIEMQIYDSYGRAEVGKHDCGAIYDVQEPNVNAVKPPGQWNRVTITAKGPKIHIVMNGKEIIDMDLNDWPEPHKNKDGTTNKFNIAYKDMARVGAIGFQDHGKPVWYRNIKIKALD